MCLKRELKSRHKIAGGLFFWIRPVSERGIMPADGRDVPSVRISLVLAAG